MGSFFKKKTFPFYTKKPFNFLWNDLMVNNFFLFLGFLLKTVFWNFRLLKFPIIFKSLLISIILFIFWDWRKKYFFKYNESGYTLPLNIFFKQFPKTIKKSKKIKFEVLKSRHINFPEFSLLLGCRKRFKLKSMIGII